MNKNKFFIFSMLCLTFIAAFFTGCKKDASKEIVQEDNGFPRHETLYVGGFDWAPPTTFNPLEGDPNFPIDGNMKLMYESLFAYNQLSGKLEPMLATSYTQNDSMITVTLDEKAKWSDGSPVTVEDVAYSFYLDSIFP
ncbi:MAG TPA: ABC transporter substrate-binding protein, partial [Fibrobacter sp.]|nr:ABC transporter substrate-binding protein [Fibrobacter sp.]